MKANRHRNRAGIVILLTFLTFATAFAGEKIKLTLKSQAIIVGPEIKLTDVCTVSPKDKKLVHRLDKIVLGRAAPPGEAKEVTRSLIKMHLRRVRLYDKLESMSGPRSVRVRTAQKDITRVKIEDAVATFLSKKLKDAELEWRFDYARIADKIAGPVTDYQFKVRLLKARLRKGHTAFEIRVINNGKTVNRTKVTGILRTFENVAVAKTTIDRGTRLNRTDFHLEKKETTYIPGDPMRAQHVVEAIESRVRIPKGKIIMQNMVADIPSVRKGETIQLEIKAGSVFLQTEALSQQDGAVDDIIRVWLQDTRKTLKGIVVGKGKVLVEL